MKLTLLFFILSVIITQISCNSLEQAFRKEEIIPDVLDDVPQKVLLVKYKNDIEVNLGNQLASNQTQELPQIQFDAISDVDFYALLIVDPDPPSRKDPKFREILHCMIVNIPGNKIQQGEVKASYIGPAPPKDSGLHRYVFLVFKQMGKQTFEEPQFASVESRKYFSVKKFVDKHNLGRAVYGNFFQAQFEDN